MKNEQLKGFTILETLISLMLMSIIISLVYALLNLVNKQMSLFETENFQIIQYNLFNRTIKTDIGNANDFEINKNHLVLKYYNGSKINYTINGNYILRQNQTAKDTFKVKVADYKFLNADISNPLNVTFDATIKLLKDTIYANYFLNKTNSDLINKMYFNED